METSRKGEPASAFSSDTFGQDYSFTLKEPVGAMSISPCGRDVVLASRQGLHVIDLDSPWATPRHLPHYTPWEVADVQWSPFSIRDYWVISTSNQKALVWNLMMNDVRSAVEHYLHAHTRAITDINFSAHHPDILATCAVDSFVHCWDLRHPVRPALSFADWFAGATQVKWNRQDPHIVASSHDKTLRIWDDRKGAHPLHSIEAHDTKIYGLDWNRIHTTALVTCSLDKTIKFWDYSVDLKSPERVIETSFPIWRARHTPFGHGVLAMPQRDDNNLYLYDRRAITPENDISSPVKSFHGHEGQVKEFLWRCRGNVDNDGTDHREFQLVTWGADHSLKLHPMEDTTLSEVGYVRGQKSPEKQRYTRNNANYKTFRNPSSNLDFRAIKSSSSLQEQSNARPSFSVVKSGITLPSRPVGVSEGFLNARDGVYSKTNHKKELDPISWMKGVKAGKKEFHPDQSVEPDGVVDNRLHRGSEEFETLGEEITHIGTKFWKVKFDDVDINQRYVEFNMNGVWDKDVPTHLKCRIEFPDDYPLLSAPVLTLEETALSEKETLFRIERDVRTIGNTYLRLRRSSLEAIIRYLHGEQSLDDALRWALREFGPTIAEIGDSSSDEDDVGHLGEDHESDFGLADSGLFGQPNANAYMPLAKACAGVWSRNGMLVCFFPPKAKPTVLPGSLSSHRQNDLLKSKKGGLLGSFGRLSNTAHGRSQIKSTSSLDDQESSSETDFTDSEYSSSASSTSSHATDIKDVLAITQHVFDVDHFEPIKYGSERAIDGTLQSADSLSGSNFLGPPPKSIITLHDLRHELPAKKELAVEYVCSGSHACQNNAAVAMKHGYPAIAETWRLLDLILRDTFVTSSKPVSTSQTLSKGSSSQLLDTVSQKDVKTSHTESISQIVDFVRWSSHPFGGRILIKKLFEHYADMADVQMLAMMSCILSERDQNMAVLRAVKEFSNSSYDFSRINGKLHSRDHFPMVKSSGRLILHGDNFKRRASSLRSPVKMNQDAGVYPSSFETVINNSGSLESSGPDTVLHHSFEAPTPTSRFSSSPEWIRPLHRSGTNLANAIMALPLTFSLTTSAASSPPTVSFMKKKVSPIGSLSTGSGLRASNSSTSAVSYSHSNSTKTSDGRIHANRQPSAPKVARGMTFKIKSKYNAHPGESRDEPLLDPALAYLYQTWRDRYADLLLNWDLLIPHAEMRKNNGLPSYNTSQSMDTDKRSIMSGTESTVKYSNSDTKTVLPMTHCRFCDNTPQPQPSELICRNCYGSCITMCALCNLPIHGRSSPCFVCGHVLHISCRETWEHHHIGTACPTGCGCICSSPNIPLEGVVKFYNDNASQLTSPRSSHFPSSHISFSGLRSPSPAASTIRNISRTSLQDHTSPHSTSVRTGSHTPRDPPPQTTPQIAYASLQFLAAQSRPRGDTTSTRHSSTTTTTTNNKSSKLRASKSLMFATGFGMSGTSTPTDQKRPKGNSGTRTPSFTGNVRRLSAAKGGAGNRKENVGGQTTPVLVGDDLPFDWGLGEMDDSDVEGR